MRLYNKYIIKHLLLPTLFITLTLTGVAWLVRSLRFIDLIVNRGLDVTTFLYLSGLIVPALLLIILPIALFCSVIFLYNKLINESEIIVLKSAGLSRLSLAVPAIIVAVIITLLGYSVSFYFLPKSYGEFKDTQNFIRNNYVSALLQEGVFNSTNDGKITIYIDERLGNEGLLKGILLYDNRDAASPKTYMAESGKLEKSDNGPRIILNQGNINQIDNKSGNLQITHFDTISIDVTTYAEKTAQRYREPEERFINELLNPDNNEQGIDKAKFLAEGHHRIIWPLYSLVFTLLAVTLILSGEFNRRGQWLKIVSSILIATLIIAIDLALKNLVVRTPQLAFIMYSNIVLVFLFCFYMLTSSNNIFTKIKYYNLNRNANIA